MRRARANNCASVYAVRMMMGMGRAWVTRSAAQMPSTGYFDVEDRQVRLSRAGKDYGLLTGARLSHRLMSQRGQLRPQAQQVDALVIGDQDTE